MNISGALAGTNSGSSFTAAIGVGGFGGNGGTAGEVKATVIGDVRATGLESRQLCHRGRRHASCPRRRLERRARAERRRLRR